MNTPAGIAIVVGCSVGRVAGRRSDFPPRAARFNIIHPPGAWRNQTGDKR